MEKRAGIVRLAGRGITRVLVALGVSLLMLAGIGMSTPAFADSDIPVEIDGPLPKGLPPLADATTDYQQVEMGLDCVDITPAAKQYADDHDLCRSGTDDVRWGNCGYSYVWISDAGGGRARMSWGFGSILGTVVRRELTVWWSNLWTNYYGGFIDANWMWSPAWSNSITRYVGRGRVGAMLTGSVRLNWGGTCVMLNPFAATDIY